MFLQKRIYEWCRALPSWQSDLVRRLAAGPLDAASEIEVLKILENASDAPVPVGLELKDLPVDEGEVGRVELRGIRDLRNMNCLVSGQTLSFEPGLNAVFGENGTGKSGYGRLARRVTRSGEYEEILRDVFDPGSATGPQTAELDIAVDGNQRTVSVDLSSDPDRVLSAMAVFDSSRARTFLAKPNVIEHVPRPLRLLRLLSQAQDELVKTLRERVEKHRGALPALPELESNTATGKSLAGLDAGSDHAALVAQAALTVAETTTLDELEVSAAAIRADQGEQLEAAARTQVTNARSAGATLTEADAQLPKIVAAEIADLRRRLEDVNVGERALADSAFADQRFAATGQGPWREMWLAAERFAQASGALFPGTGDDAACPLCQQDLDEAARRRLRSFKEFISGTLREEAVDLNARINTRLKQLPDLATVRASVQADVRGAPDEIIAAAGQALAILDRRAAGAHKAAAGEQIDFNAEEVTVAALHTHCDAQEKVAERHAGLRDEDGRRKVMTELGELRARSALLEAQDTIVTHVKGLKTIARMEAAIGQLNTQKINTKLRELQEVAVTERLRKAVEHELRELDPVAGAVQITGQASKGETVIQLRLKEPCKAKLGTVLSDGEQRALSLAFFLAESAVSDGRSTIVLDDPVSSLDHHRRAYLAERLVEESRRRQVIVFTHDMAFLHLLQQAAEDAGVELHGQTLQRAFHRVGMVADEELPSKMLGTAKQLRTLRHRLRFKLTPLHKSQNPAFEQEADRWVADLRKAYEQVIVDTMLNGTVRPFNPHLRVRQLHGIQWTPDRAAKVDQGMKKASPKAHREPLELHPAPHTPSELTAMLDDLLSLHEEMGGKAETPIVALPGPADEQPVVRAAQPHP